MTKLPTDQGQVSAVTKIVKRYRWNHLLSCQRKRPSLFSDGSTLAIITSELADKSSLSGHDLRANTGVRKNFQQKRMRRAAIDEVNFFHALGERVQRAFDFRDHATAND